MIQKIALYKALLVKLIMGQYSINFPFFGARKIVVISRGDHNT
jgi:hypothetical protein